MKNYELTFGAVQTHVNLIDIGKSCKMSLPLQKIGFGTADNGPSKVRITNTGPSNSLCQVHTPDDASPLPRRHSAIRSSLAIRLLCGHVRSVGASGIASCSFVALGFGGGLSHRPVLRHQRVYTW